ncbi:hypothetical protein [Hyalangium rubrum]|uniref:Uncharacterized protein n=1 Tax=Hyalangium rubrum TaxID=3103134 RepID=A0ABU5HHT1_9BACT|nr:hypothetical protein [Hyalangium sp. s54d21]MDY7232916.1 hypothetical protein [Hyalangium sp. s54d21]
MPTNAKKEKKKARQKETNAMVTWWEAEVGPRPAILEAALGGLLTHLKAPTVWNALKSTLAKHPDKDPQKILDEVHRSVRPIRRQKLGLKPKTQTQQKPKPKAEKVIDWWRRNIGDEVPRLEARLTRMANGVPLTNLKRALKGAQVKAKGAGAMLKKAEKHVQSYRKSIEEAGAGKDEEPGK